MEFLSSDRVCLDSVLSPLWAYIIDSSAKCQLRLTSKCVRKAVDFLVNRIEAPSDQSLGIDIIAAGMRWPNSLALILPARDARSAEDAASALDDRAIPRLHEFTLKLVSTGGRIISLKIYSYNPGSWDPKADRFQSIAKARGHLP